VTLNSVRRLATHAAVASAFASMAISGSLPVWAIAGFSALVVAAFALDGKIAARLGFFPTLAAGLCLILLAGLTFFGALDLVVAASAFAAVLAANRLLLRRSAADDGLLFLSALLMLAGGAALSADVLYAACFAAFAVSFTLGMTYSCLSRSADEVNGGTRLLEGPASVARPLALAALGFSTLAGAVLAFSLFPRVNFGAFHPRLADFGPPVVGFSEQVRLDGIGALKDDTRVMLRFQIQGFPTSRTFGKELDLLWRGRTYERYDGTGWSKASRGQRTKAGDVESGVPDTRVTVSVPPGTGLRAIFVPGRPIRVSAPKRPASGAGTDFVSLTMQRDGAGDLKLDRAPEPGYQYEALAQTEADPPLRGRGTDYPKAIRDAYLSLPPLDPRIPALANSLAPSGADPDDVALAIQRHLLHLQYTTELPGNVSDPLANFLFDRKAGHCEYFSTAMAVMLRTRGIPARNATGFLGGRRVPTGDYYVLLGGDAHSWTEVYFPDVGWVAFDPTPPDSRRAAPSGLRARLAELMDAWQVKWNTLVVDYSLTDQLQAAQGAVRAIAAARDRVSSGGIRGLGRAPSGAAAGLILLSGAWLFVRLWRSPDRRRKTTAATRRYQAMLRRLARLGFQKPNAMTATEFCQELARRQYPGLSDVETATAAYLAARFSGVEPSPEALAAIDRGGRAIIRADQ
jgi:protein-glutamine gamma-glutamyltransferase